MSRSRQSSISTTLILEEGGHLKARTCPSWGDEWISVRIHGIPWDFDLYLTAERATELIDALTAARDALTITSEASA